MRAMTNHRLDHRHCARHNGLPSERKRNTEGNQKMQRYRCAAVIHNVPMLARARLTIRFFLP
jgi:hypothetical protein